MARFFVPLDVNYQMDDKIMCAGPLAECLYVRSLAYAKRAGTEGRIQTNQLRALALGLPGAAAKHATKLVEAELWERRDNGWYIVGWLNHNLTNAELAEQKANIRKRSTAGNHKRHHLAKGVVDEDCELCNAPNGEATTLPKSSNVGTKTVATEEEQKKNRTEHELKKNRTEDEEESSSIPDISTRRQPNIAAAALKILLDHRLKSANTPGLEPMLKKTLPDEHREAIGAFMASHPETTAAEIAAVVLKVPGLTYATSTPRSPWYADPNCDECEGDGWWHPLASVDLQPCRCRRADPYIATVTPIRPEPTA